MQPADHFGSRQRAHQSVFAPAAAEHQRIDFCVHY
jgi:hypothetical protein